MASTKGQLKKSSTTNNVMTGIFLGVCQRLKMNLSQPAIVCSKLKTLKTIKTFEQGVKYVQS